MKAFWMMRLLHKQLFVLGMFLTAGVGSLVSVTSVEAATPITRAVCDTCEESGRFVRLQQVTEEGSSIHGRQFIHPFVLSPADWASLLNGLQVARQAEGVLFHDPPGPVLHAFTPEEIEYLSVTLSQAFGQAKPQEMVVFGLSRMNAYDMTEITTGGWFLEEGSLHLILANYRKAATMPSTRQLLWERPLRPDAGPRYDLIAGQHQTLVRNTGGWSGLFSPAPSELMLGYQAILTGEAIVASPSEEPSTPFSGVVPPSKSIEDRLRVLKRLHDQGLITEDDYRSKKQQLLDQF